MGVMGIPANLERPQGQPKPLVESCQQKPAGVRRHDFERACFDSDLSILKKFIFNSSLQW